MRNFEADKLIRIGDVMDFLEEYTRYDDEHSIDLGEAGDHVVPCENIPNLEGIQVELLKKVVEDG